MKALGKSTGPSPHEQECNRVLADLQAANRRRRAPVAPAPQGPTEVPGHISFASQGNSQPFRLFGWDHPEERFTWTTGTETFLQLPCPRHPEPLMLNARIDPMVGGNVTLQQVEVAVGEETIAHWTVRCAGHYFCLVWPRHFQSGSLDLRFRVPGAASPKSLGLSDDSRVLGLLFHDLWLGPVQPPNV